MSIKIVIVVDKTTEFRVFVPKSDESPLLLWQVKIENRSLAKAPVANLAEKAGQEQVILLAPGVYFVITTKTLEYRPSQDVRVAVNGGKDPWPQPPPPAPAGTDLAANESIYKAGFSDLTVTAGSSPAWVSLTSQPSHSGQRRRRHFNGKRPHAARH